MRRTGAVAAAVAVASGLVLSVSCSDPPPDQFTGSATTMSSPTTTTTPADTTSDESTEDGAEDTEDPKFDVGQGTMGDDGIDTGDESCKKVDILFVIDNSGSMADEQANLVASVPGFIAAMQKELAETEGYHIGVVTTDLYIYDISCAPLSIGNLVTETGGTDSSNGICDPYSSGQRYMTEWDDLPDKFGCAAQVGTAGDGDERPMEAMITALSPPLTDKGSCNEGFLRDDALLVVVIITDEEDDHETIADACSDSPMPGSDGEPDSWFDAMVDIKGKEGNIVVLSLVGPDAESGSMCPELDKCNGGITGAEVAPRILEFTRMFTYGFVGPVCENYGPIFQESISVIKTACDEFDPVG